MRTNHTREGTAADVPAVVEIGKAMHAESRYARLPWDGERLARTLSFVMASDTGLFLVTVDDGQVVGGFAALATDHWFLHAPACTNLGIFVRPEQSAGLIGLRLLRGYARWARVLGIPDELHTCSAFLGDETAICRAAGYELTANVFSYKGD